MQSFAMSRRSFSGALLALAAGTVTGCGRRPADGSAASSAVGNTAQPQALSMTVYRDPSCGCCEAWAALAKDAGYRVRVVDHPDMPAIKRQYRVPDGLQSCHTAIVGAYAIEGHVPLDDVKRLLDIKPAKVRGIAVAGMPRGSPGMEMPDGSKDPFEVIAFAEAGNSIQFGA